MKARSITCSPITVLARTLCIAATALFVAQLQAEVKFSAEQRFRVESIHDNFRPGRVADDLVLSRTQLRASYLQAKFALHGEVVDARVWGADEDTALNTGMANALEWVQAYADFRWQGLKIEVGQMTREDGSRRILARNRFRNTTNFFRGIDVSASPTDQLSWRLFYLLPNQAVPGDHQALRDAERATDRFSSARRLFGGSMQFEFARSKLDIGYYAIRDRDKRAVDLRGRHLNALSVRLDAPQLIGAWHLHSHSILEWGRADERAQVEQSSRLRAFMQRFALQRPLDQLQRLLLTVSLDVARGDDDPSDSTLDTFDTLFGVQRFEWGPGSLYGAFRRSNVISPALRLDWRGSTQQHDVTLRPVWLFAREDAWAGTGIRDSTGRSGRYVGTQIDVRLRKQLGRRVGLEVGGAYLHYGAYARRLINHHGSNHTRYGYAQITLKI